jgi:hypothetical protein
MKKNNSQSVISLSSLREIQNIITPVPTKAELRKSVDDEIKKLSDARVSQWKNTIKNAAKLKLEKERAEFIKKNKDEIENIKILHQNKLNNTQNKNLENTQILNLIKQFENSSKQIDNITKKFNNEKLESKNSDKYAFEQRERNLQRKEQRLNDKQKSLLIEKETLNRLNEDLKRKEIERKNYFQNEKEKIEQELIKLKEFENNINSIAPNSKELLNKNKVDYEYQKDLIKIKNDKFDAEKKNEEEKLNQKVKLLEEDKKLFEKYKNDLINMIQKQKNEFLKEKNNFYNEYKQFKEALQSIHYDEMQLFKRLDDAEKEKLELERRDKELEQKENNILIANKRIDLGIQKIKEKQDLIESEKEKIKRLYEEYEMKSNEFTQQFGYTV